MLTLSNLFSDGAVFQRGRDIIVFGEGTGSFRAEFLGEVREVEANGHFEVVFSAHPAGGPYEMKVWLDGEKRVIRDLMIGEVFFMSGQSNSALTIGETFDKDTFFESDPYVRVFMRRRPEVDSLAIIRHAEGLFSERWTSLKSGDSNYWSAILLHVALYYRKKLGIPIGFIQCDKWGTLIQSFLNEGSNAMFRDEFEGYLSSLSPEARERRLHGRHAWDGNAFLYHFMFEALFPVQFRAAIWYQGEANVGEDAFHDRMLARLIEQWREDFRNDDMAAAVIGINDHPDKGRVGTTRLRESQKRACSLVPNAVFVKIDDLGEYAQIHPRNKREAAARVCEALDTIL